MILTQTDILAILFTLTIVCAVWVAALIYYRKMRALIAKDFSKLKEYRTGINAGLASGFIVIVVDRTITLFMNNLPKLNFQDVILFLVSLFNSVLEILLVAGIILFGLSFVVYMSLRPMKCN